jgi:hypothetical protein
MHPSLVSYIRSSVYICECCHRAGLISSNLLRHDLPCARVRKRLAAMLCKEFEHTDHGC